MARREYQGAAQATTLAAGIGPADLSISLAAAVGWPTGAGSKPFFIVIDRGLAGEEKVLVTSRTSTTLTVASTGNRGVDGTTAASHLSGAAVEHVFTATDADDANGHIFDTTRDDHPQYLQLEAVRDTIGAVLVAGDGTTITVDDPGNTVTIAAVPTSLAVPAGAFGPTGGSPTLGANSNGYASAWRFDQSAQQLIAAYFGPVPAGWNTVAVDLWWSNEVATAGNVKWGLLFDNDGDGTAIGGSANVTTTVAAPAQAVLKKTTLGTGLAVTAGNLMNIEIVRVAADVADTLAGDASVLLVNIRRLT